MERWHRAIGAAAPQRTLGGNITWQTETYYLQPSAPYWRATQPSYAVVGLMARYEMDKHWSMSVHVNNLFDKTYCRVWALTAPVSTAIRAMYW